jgi:hypothetical protein
MPTRIPPSSRRTVRAAGSASRSAGERRGRNCVAQVRQASCTVIWRTSADAQRAAKYRLTLRGSIGSPYRVVNTRSERVHAWPASPRARSCLTRRCCNAATHTGGNGSVASDARVLVSRCSSLQPTRCSCWPIVSSASSRSTSSQVRPRTSPLRRPSTRISTYAAYSVVVTTHRSQEGPRLRNLGGDRPPAGLLL